MLGPLMSEPNVYLAGPIDYIEHRSPGNHVRDNWRHRFFEDLPINLFCPTCLNRQSTGAKEIMEVNRSALAISEFFIGHFPGDEPTFGTPIEVWTWFSTRGGRSLKAVLVHPAKPGVFVEHLQDHGLVVVRQFVEARAWLQRQLQSY